MTHPLASRPALKALLDKLHAASIAQEGTVAKRGEHFPKRPEDKQLFEDQLVALDEDKARDMYLILRAMGARRVVEAGTSYGVSTLWLLAAVTDNEESSIPSTNNFSPLVIGTEYETKKAAKALEHVKQGFDGQIPSCFKLLEGDLLKTLVEENIPDKSIDALLLDIWANLALPILKIILPKLRVGSVVFADNTAHPTDRYREFLDFVRNPENGFKCSTMPHSGGFELCVYVGN